MESIFFKFFSFSLTNYFFLFKVIFLKILSDFCFLRIGLDWRALVNWYNPIIEKQRGIFFPKKNIFQKLRISGFFDHFWIFWFFRVFYRFLDFLDFFISVYIFFFNFSYIFFFIFFFKFLIFLSFFFSVFMDSFQSY